MRLLTQKIKYNLKRALPILTIAGAGLMASCDKSDDEPQRDVEIHFTKQTADENLALEVLQKHIADKSVRNIYMVAEGNWDGSEALNITQMRERFFQPRIDMSPKIHGRGDFTFFPGEASKVPADSLWYVQQGWTINKRFQKQK